MSGPYFNGLGRKKKRKASIDDTDSENSTNFFSSQPRGYGSDTPKRRRITPTEAEVIPKFNPEERNSNVKGWLNKIDQLGDVYDWHNKDRQFVMQIRLRGSARDWYDDLEDYNLTWDEWKQTLQTAFPRSTDFVDRLEEMMSRSKIDTETMTKYFHDKLSLLKKCNIYNEDAISCIIKGLPSELRANAKAYQCETPEQLYYGYLSSLENFKRVEAAASTRRQTWRRGNTTTAPHTLPKICYACRRPGHEARDCRALLHCDVCQRNGHGAATCWFAAGSSKQQIIKVYKGLDVVTAKATAAERAQVPHHLLDMLEPHQNFTVVDFRNRALKIIQELTERGKIPIVVGGTNYYMESIIYNILVEDMSDSEELLWNRSTRKRDIDEAGPSANEPNVKNPTMDITNEDNDKKSDVESNKDNKAKPHIEITYEIDKEKVKYEVDNERLLTNEDIHLRLMSIDPVMAERLHPNNRRKMLRSIEVWLKTGRRHSDILEEQKQREGCLRRPGATILLWLRCEQKVHDERLDSRVDSMLEQGLIQELLDFHQRHNKQRLKDGKPPDYTRGIFQTLGFKEFHDYLMLSEEERQSRPELLQQSIDNMKMGTRRYARRQNKMVRGRFMEHPNREVPPIYELDTTDISAWDTQVKEKAIHIIESYLNGTPCQYEPLTSETREVKKDINPFSNNYCEVCKRVLIGDKEYRIHLQSNRHMKVLKKRKLEEKKKLESQAGSDV